jgi:hypothetical protein
MKGRDSLNINRPVSPGTILLSDISGDGLPGVDHSFYNAAKLIGASFAETNREGYGCNHNLIGRSGVDKEYRKYLAFNLIINI